MSFQYSEIFDELYRDGGLAWPCAGRRLQQRGILDRSEHDVSRMDGAGGARMIMPFLVFVQARCITPGFLREFVL